MPYMRTSVTQLGAVKCSCSGKIIGQDKNLIRRHTQQWREAPLSGWALASGAEGSRFKQRVCTFFYKNSLFTHAAVFGYPTLFRAGKGEGGEELEWRSTSVTTLSVQVGSLHQPLPRQSPGIGKPFLVMVAVSFNRKTTSRGVFWTKQKVCTIVIGWVIIWYNSRIITVYGFLK